MNPRPPKKSKLKTTMAKLTKQQQKTNKKTNKQKDNYLNSLIPGKSYNVPLIEQTLVKSIFTKL